MPRGDSWLPLQTVCRTSGGTDVLCAVTLLVLQSRSAMADAAVSADFRNQNQFPACHRRLRSRA